MVEYANLPKFSEYDVDDLKQLYKTFIGLKLPDGEVYLSLSGVPINVEDIERLEQEEAISYRVVALFANYINKLQRMEKNKYNKNNGNRTYVIAVNVVNYDKYYKKVKYELFFGFQNEYKKNPNKIYEDYDKVIIIMKYDDRWMATAIDLKTSTYHIADFLADDLSRVKFDETLEVVKYVAQTEFKLKYESQEFYDFKKLNFLCDCGIYTLNYVYKCINNTDLSLIKTKFNEKELFKKQLIWIILKLKNAKKVETHIYNFIPLKDDEKKKVHKKEKEDEEKVKESFEDSLEKSMQKMHSRSSHMNSVKASREKAIAGTSDLFDFPNNDSFASTKKTLSRLEDNSFPSINPNKGGSKTPLLTGSISEIKFNPKGYSVADNDDMLSLNKFKTATKLSTQDSMIELKRDQLQEILTNFKKEVEDAVLKKKEKGRKHKMDITDDSEYNDRSNSDTENSKSYSRESSRRSTNSSVEKSIRHTSLPPIHQNGYYPSPYDGMQYNMGHYNGMPNPYEQQYNRNPSQSSLSRSRNTSLDSSNLSSNSSILAAPLKKGKKKDREVYEDDPDLFNYSRGKFYYITMC